MFDLLYIACFKLLSHLLQKTSQISHFNAQPNINEKRNPFSTEKHFSK